MPHNDILAKLKDEQHISTRSGANTEVIPFSAIYRIFKPTG